MFLNCSNAVLAVPVKVCSKCGEVKPATDEYYYVRKSNGRLWGYCKSCADKQHKERYNENREHYLEYKKKWASENYERKSAANREWYSRNKERLNAENKRRYHEDPEYREQVKEQHKNWRANHKEQKAATNKAWHYANRDRIIAKQRLHYTENRDEINRKRKANHREPTESQREYSRQWRLLNSDKKKANHHNREARKRGLPDTFTASDWQIALDHFGGCCAVCGRQPGLWHTLAADHWIPLNSENCPGTVAWNTIPLCHGIGGCNNSKSDQLPSKWLIEKYGKRKGGAILKRINEFLDSRKR